MKYLIIVAISLTSCEFDVDPEFYVDLRLEPYVTAFYHEADMRGIVLSRDIVVRVEAIDIHDYGKSSMMGPQHIVLISADNYVDYRDTTYFKGDTLYCAMENLVYHELGHALLNRRHCDPCYSIMHSTMSLFEYVGQPEKRRLLINELFENSNLTP